jgi:signal transduction histidine kinase/ActR/RegA family two-component response regulator
MSDVNLRDPRRASRTRVLHAGAAIVLAAISVFSPSTSAAVEAGALLLGLMVSFLVGGVVIIAVVVSRVLRHQGDLACLGSWAVVCASTAAFVLVDRRWLRRVSTAPRVVASTLLALPLAVVVTFDSTYVAAATGAVRTTEWHGATEGLVAVLAALSVGELLRLRRDQRSTPGAYVVLLVGVTIMFATTLLWERNDRQVLASTVDSAAISLLASANDELTVLATKVSSSSAESVSVDDFPTFIEVTVRGQRSIVSASLAKLPPGGSPQLLSTVSEQGDIFDSAMARWAAVNVEKLQVVLTVGVLLDLGLVDFPNPDGTTSSYFVLAAPLTVNDESVDAATLLLAAMSLDRLIESATVATSAGRGETIVELFAPEGSLARRVASTDATAPRGELLPQEDLGANPSTEATERATFGGTEYTLMSRIGPELGLSTAERTSVLAAQALLAMALAALVLTVRVQSETRERERLRREVVLAAALQGSPGWTAIVDGSDRIAMSNMGAFHVEAGESVMASSLWSNDPVMISTLRRMLDAARGGDSSTTQVLWSDPLDSTLSMRIVEVSVRPLPGVGLVFLQSIDVTEMRDRAMRTSQSERMEAIGVLAGGLAHDFNNLLFITLGYLQMLERQPIVAGDQQARTYVGRAVEAVERGAKVAKSLLSFARSQPLAASRVDLDDYIKDLTPLIEQAIGSAHQLRIEVEDDQLGVVVDPGRLSSALLNVVFNARDAMETKGQLTLRVAKEIAAPLEKEPRPVVAISISDTGKGMPPEVAARAFEPFFTTKKVGSGTGLGLATLYSFAQQSGGWAAIDSTEGVGTTISLYLPSADEDAGDEVVEERDATLTTRALVIDDEPALADLVSAWLGDLGIATRTANTPEAALRVAREFKPQLVVSDANLNAELDGLEVARLLVEEYPSLIVVFMTGFSDRIKALQAAGVATLAKPFSREDLLATLSKTAGLRWERGPRG